MTEIESVLAGRISLSEVRRTAARVTEDPDGLMLLWQLTRATDRRTSVNALWVMTHLPPVDALWLQSIQSELIDMLLSESDTAKKRMLLQLLREQDYTPDSLRTEFIDFCLSKINAECEPYAVRAFSLYAAFKICRFYPELVSELEERLEMMSFQSLSPGLVSARRRVQAEINKLKKSDIRKL